MWAPLLRFVAGGVLLAAGFGKIMQPVEEVAAAFEAYQFIPEALLPALARIVPWTEFLLGGYIVCGYGLRWTLKAGMGLLTVFIFILLSSILRGMAPADCGCFGHWGPHLAPRLMLALDFFLLACLALAHSQKRHLWALDNWIDG